MDNEYQNEEWRDIPNYEGLYQVSSSGSVKSSYRGGRILRQCMYGDYLTVCLSKNSKTTRFPVHKLVAWVFIGQQPPNTLVHHVDTNKLNNRADNLEYVSPSYNVSHNTQILGKTREGMKLTREQVLEMLRLRQDEGLSGYELAKRFGIGENHAYAILRGKSWRYLPGRPFFNSGVDE